MHKSDLALDNLQWLFAIKPNQNKSEHNSVTEVRTHLLRYHYLAR